MEVEENEEMEVEENEDMEVEEKTGGSSCRYILSQRVQLPAKVFPGCRPLGGRWKRRGASRALGLQED
ncbi:unnamed protein product [Merluccius merluccius]